MQQRALSAFILCNINVFDVFLDLFILAYLNVIFIDFNVEKCFICINFV